MRWNLCTEIYKMFFFCGEGMMANKGTKLLNVCSKIVELLYKVKLLGPKSICSGCFLCLAIDISKETNASR